MFKVLVKKTDPLKKAIRMMSDLSLHNYIPGFAVVVDDCERVIGAVTDGDLRRAILSGGSFDGDVESIMSKHPITVNVQAEASEYEIYQHLTGKLKDDHNPRIQEIILVGDDQRFRDVISYNKILSYIVRNKILTIYGLGFVGLPLAAVFANNGFTVNGIDSNEVIIEDLRKSRLHFFEEGLDSLLEILNAKRLINFCTELNGQMATDIHIVAVGTPVVEKQPDLTNLLEATETICKVLKSGDLVIYRSTIPVGTTRNRLIPTFEQSGLIVGIDFTVASAPERTVEGKALEESQTSPLVAGG